MEEEVECGKSGVLPSDPAGEEELIFRIRNSLSDLMKRHAVLLKRAFKILLFIMYMVYYGFALSYDSKGCTALSVFTGLGLAALCYNWMVLYTGPAWKWPASRSVYKWLQIQWFWLGWIFCTMFLVLSVVYLAVMVIETVQQLRCLFGALFFLIVATVLSKAPQKIRWKFVICFFFVHILFCSLVLRTSLGFRTFKFIWRVFMRFLMSNTAAGAAAVYGDPFFVIHPLAMLVTSLVIYFGCAIAIIYQLLKVINLVRWMKGLLGHMTDSQLHMFLSFMHCIISGFALAFTSIYGIKLRNLLTGISMTMPGAAMMSLITYPETHPHPFWKGEKKDKEKQPSTAAGGFFVTFATAATKSFRIAFFSVALMIGFYSIYSFMDQTFIWLATRVGFDINISEFVGYGLQPVAWLIGIPWNETYVVGCMIAERTFGITMDPMKRLGYLSLSEAIQEDLIPTVTYAILGVSAIASLSILMSIFEVIAPRQTRRLLYMFPRIMFTVDLTCLYSASLGVILTPAFMVEEKIQDPDRNHAQHLFIWMFNQLPSYSTLMKIIRY